MAVVIPYTKQTWTDGSGGGTPISATRLGVLEEGVFDLSFAPCVRAFHNANQSITTATVTALALNSERFDQAANAADTMHDTVTNNSRLTCRYAGIYVITGLVEWTSNATGERAAFIRLNGATDLAASRFSAGAATVLNHCVTCIWNMAVNDYVELTAYQTSGAGLNVLSSSARSPELMMHRVG